jgi:predicted ATPase
MGDVAATAHDAFLRSLELARQQGALAWELRTATSLALRLREQDRPEEAHRLLGDVYNRFTEGNETADLKRARRFMDQLAAGVP